MIRDSRNFLWIVPLVLLLAYPLWKPLAVGFLKPEPGKTVQSPPSLRNSRALTSAEMDGVQLEQSKNGIREWYLTAGHLNSREGDSYMEMEDVSARFFDGEGKDEAAHIRSRRAIYNSDTRLLTLLGSVLVQNRQGYEMRTESLEYTGVDKKIKATSKVRVTGSNIDVRAGRLLYDLPTGDYSLEGNVVCRMW